MFEKLLTVIVPVYNMQKYLKKCLDSLIVDGYMEKLEVLIIDDGSTDESITISRKYELRYPGTFTVITKENGGVGTVMNMGIERCKGKYFKELDADDWLNKTALKSLISYIEESDVDLIINPFAFANSDHKFIKLVRYPITQNYKLTNLDGLMEMNLDIPMQAMTVKSEVFSNRQLQLKESRYYVDIQLTHLCIAYCNTAAILRGNLYRYRINLGEQSTSLNSYIKNKVSFFSQIEEDVRLYEMLKQMDCPYKTARINRLRLHLLTNCRFMYIILIMSKEPDSREWIQNFDRYILNKEPEIYIKLQKWWYIKLLRRTKFHHFRKCQLLFKNYYYLKKKSRGTHVFEDI